MSTSSTVKNPLSWPVLARYPGARLRRVAMPLGGIGTGTVSLGGRGDLRDWEIVNYTAKGYTPKPAFFALHARCEGRPDFTRVLEGPVDAADLYGRAGSTIPHAGFPRFARAECETTCLHGGLRLGRLAIDGVGETVLPKAVAVRLRAGGARNSLRVAVRKTPAARTVKA